MNLKEVLINGYNKLKYEAIDSYQLDTQLLLCKVLNKDRIFILTNPDYKLNEEELNEFYDLLNLRKNKMPMKYILGKAEFMGIEFNVKEGVLIPRPDTEILVESVIEEIKQNNFTDICDLCCGSGIIGITIARFLKNTNIESYDISDIAFNVTLENINKFSLGERVKVYKSDLLQRAIENHLKFDVIVSNPPYIREKIIETLMEDVKEYEPFEALCGGKDGLDFYRKIAFQSLKVLKKSGIIAFEIGYDQKEDVEEILKMYEYINIECIKDLAGKNRVIKAVKG
ncbi:peptide chain release factor N(5)-glutamine methyltransferase [Clostridium niameyense]|uniref:Release factor glutamine methyltransferase n=1 Tax=Clostridium niameyense TaxID=1622073 RepID=A0A6M0RC99_9CLOT|nr:peptide chain release factor N(5)-glutamine methyltransferase [Clostridium niameyense]NEZ47417.1 peptide chain release factor N(5)-glutamine methyltransferase [Clostridium niameyense]